MDFNKVKDISKCILVLKIFISEELCLQFVSSTFKIVQIIVHSHFELVSSLLALDATEPVSEPVTGMTVELINIHLISVQQKR